MKKLLSALMLALLLFACGPEVKKYKTFITYQTGETETLIMFSSCPPKVDYNGCIYNYNDGTYICGIRKVYAVEATPDE